MRIWHKLFLALLSAAAVVVAVALLLSNWSFNRGFVNYLNSVEEARMQRVAADLGQIYQQAGSWEPLLNDRGMWRDVLEKNRPGGMSQGGRPVGRSMPPPPDRFDRLPQGKSKGPERRPPPGPLGAGQPVVLLDASQNIIFGRPSDSPDARLIEIAVAGEIVGYLRYLPVSTLTDLDEQAGQQFVEQQRESLIWIALFGLFVASIVALVVGRLLTVPIRRLTLGTRRLAEGRFDEGIIVNSNDELGRLARDFNAMAESLAASRTARQQWIVDIAHELRTPLAILNGELQALEDGVRQWTPERLESLQAEVVRLTSLVNDLRELSDSDAGGPGYEKCMVDLSWIAEEVAESFENRAKEAGLTLYLSWPENPVEVQGDARRLEQLLINLLENSCRYTDAGGTVKLEVLEDGPVVWRISDSAPSVPAEAMPKLFDRLFRIEVSRSREHGGSGLGLSICKGIVEAHAGTIRALPSDLGGLCVEVELPRA